MTRRQIAGTVLGAAALVTVLTVAARLAGLGRTLVLARTVGSTELASVYHSVNTVPNIAYEIVAGGVLASLVVPLLARAVTDEDRAHVDRTSSALLTWTILTLTPLTLLIIVAAEPIAAFLLVMGSPGPGDAAAVEVGASMLRVFAPQVVLYGIGVVLTGILQAHRRFGAPALAPLLSSLVVITAYVSYAAIARGGTELGELTRREELVLSVGTTLGVVVLSLSLVPAIARLGLRLRPSLRFPSGVARHVRSLAYAGMAALAAQQASVVVALLLGNQAFEETVIVYAQAQAIFLLPWAVLAVPVATAVYPRLAERWSAGDRATYRSQLAASNCLVIVLTSGAAAAMVAAARPLARVVFEGAPGAGGLTHHRGDRFRGRPGRVRALRAAVARDVRSGRHGSDSSRLRQRLGRRDRGRPAAVGCACDHRPGARTGARQQHRDDCPGGGTARRGGPYGRCACAVRGRPGGGGEPRSSGGGGTPRARHRPWPRWRWDRCGHPGGRRRRRRHRSRVHRLGPARRAGRRALERRLTAPRRFDPRGREDTA